MGVVVALLLSPGAAAAADGSPDGVGVYDYDESRWLLRDRASGGPATAQFAYGSADGFHSGPMLCDWDGDGEATPGLLRREEGEAAVTWHLRDEVGGGRADHAFPFGSDGDRAVCGDWDGDGTETPGVVRQRADGRLAWHLRNELAGGAADWSFVYGPAHPQELPPIQPLVGDWDGDGRDTPGLARGREDGRFEWLLRNRRGGGAADVRYVYFGGATWGDALHASIPLVGDWNGDGRDTAGVAESRGGRAYRWFLRDEHGGGAADRQFVYGQSGLQAPLVWR